MRLADYGPLQFVLVMLTLLVEPASAEPLYFSCSGIHQQRQSDRPPTSARDTVSVILDLDNGRFGWTVDNATSPPNCWEPTPKEELDPKTGQPKFPKKGPFQKTTNCSIASATDLQYRFSITNDFGSWDCHEEGPWGCTEKEYYSTWTHGTIDRLTGELSASRSHEHLVERICGTARVANRSARL
jgi:hypothetical protein